MSADHKSLTQVEVKAGDRGEVTAVFSTLGPTVIDKDGDVTVAGAFEDGAEVIISSYQHTSWGGSLPIGKGRIRATKTEAILEGRFFLDTTAGRDTFTVVKELGGRQQWSYGFDVLDSEPGTVGGQRVRFLKRLKVHEVSPVLIGAGVDTRMLSVKATALLAPQEMAAREFARFVKADLAREIAAELCEIRDAIEMRAELGAIANKLRSVR